MPPRVCLLTAVAENASVNYAVKYNVIQESIVLPSCTCVCHMQCALQTNKITNVTEVISHKQAAL
jgi:hypothetical protein